MDLIKSAQSIRIKELQIPLAQAARCQQAYIHGNGLLQDLDRLAPMHQHCMGTYDLLLVLDLQQPGILLSANSQHLEQFTILAAQELELRTYTELSL